MLYRMNHARLIYERDNPPEPKKKEQHLRARIVSVSTNTITVVPQTANTELNVPVSSVPVYFKGGIAPGAYVNITYTGNFNGESTSGMKIRGITGEDPDILSVRNISSTVTGTILGTTANTVLIQTYDGVKILCDRENAQDLSTSGMEEGADLRVTFNPAKSRTSNIYTCIKFEDGRRTEFFFPRLPSSFVPPVYHPVCQKKLCFRPAHPVREEPGMHRHHFPLPHGSFSQKLSSDSAHLS